MFYHDSSSRHLQPQGYGHITSRWSEIQIRTKSARDAEVLTLRDFEFPTREETIVFLKLTVPLTVTFAAALA